MFSSRLIALAAVALRLVAAQDTVYTDDLDAGWTFSTGSRRINDNDPDVHAGGYTLVPVGGEAECKFFGSGASVYFVRPNGTTGEWKFYFDGEIAGGAEGFNPVPETQYRLPYLRKHGFEQTTHSVKVVATTGPVGIDFLIANPGPASPDDPTQD